jgi:hypothetical protein
VRKIIVCAAAFALLSACTGGDDRAVEPDGKDNLCARVERLGKQREADVTDAAAIDAVVKALPTRFRNDAALFYYPYGGDVPADADGVQAERAGERLYAYYEDTCNYTGR